MSPANRRKGRAVFPCRIRHRKTGTPLALMAVHIPCLTSQPVPLPPFVFSFVNSPAIQSHGRSGTDCLVTASLQVSRYVTAAAYAPAAPTATVFARANVTRNAPACRPHYKTPRCSRFLLEARNRANAPSGTRFARLYFPRAVAVLGFSIPSSLTRSSAAVR